jgi:TonB-linked SusC/RagA family outer membrane protein
MNKIQLRFLILFLMTILPALHGIGQQSHKVTGMIRDANTGEALIGVNIIIKGTFTGTTSGVDGSYGIDVPDPGGILQFSYIGYLPREEAIGGRTVINVDLVPDIKTIEEVVVVGYGVQRKESVVGSISSINNKAIVSIPVSNITQSIAGKLSGVQVVQTSGEIGRDEADIFIRGQATYGNSNPLIVVDGIIREGFAQIDPNEIETMSILKDASATAVYGVKGANGVIIITTKRGTEGKPQISFTTQTAVTMPTRIPQPLDSYRSALLANLHKVGGSKEAAPFNHQDLLNFRTGASPFTNPDYSWVDVMMKDRSTLTQYNINVSGGTKTIKYFISGGYLTQDGVYKYDPYTNFSRINFRSNFDINVSKNLSASINLGTRIEDRTNPATAWYGSWEIYRASFALGGRFTPVFNPDGSLAGNSNRTNLIGSVRDRGFFKEIRSVMELGVNLNYKLDFVTPGLSVRGQLAFDDNGSMNRNYEQTFPVFQYDLETNSYTEFGESRPLYYAWGNVYNTRKTYYELSLNYARTFGRHNMTGLLLANRDLKFINDQTPFATEGLVGRLTYDYSKRYLAEINVGFNGSENFAPGHRYGLFPAFALGWIITNEPFLQNSAFKSVVSGLKLRGSLGWVGNDKIGNDRFIYLQQYEEAGGAMFGTGDNWYQGIRQGTIANLNVQWEVARKQNIGFESDFFNGLFGMNVDYFYEYRDKILTTITNTSPSYIGATFSAANIGIVKNEGFEIEFRHNNSITQDISYYFRGNFSYAHNTVVKKDDAYMTLDYQKEEGYPIGTSVKYIATGIFQSYEDIYDSPPQISQLGGIAGNNVLYPGDLKFMDVNNDGVINRFDQVRTGYSYVPEVTYGATLGFNIGNFDFSALLQGVARASFEKNWEIMWHFSNNENVFPKHWNYWTPETSGSEEYVRLYGPYQNNESGSTYSLGSGQYIRLKNAEVGYTLPNSLLKKIRTESLRIYVSGVNLILWAKEPYIDPDNRNQRGGNMPPLKSVNIGIKLNF